MKKTIALIAVILALLLLLLLMLFVFNAKDHHYKHSDRISGWLYTPDTLKKAPLLSNDIDYAYSYNIDTQAKYVVITYQDLKNIEVSRQQLLDFIGTIAAPKYNCAWIYNNPDDFSKNYQRYCVYKKGDTLELEYYEIP